MQTKKDRIDNLKNISNQMLQTITENREEFKKYLSFQSRLFKYKFEETLLIYGQNPNAMACATLEQWNKIGRKIHRGQKATHIFTDELQKHTKYVFELSQTYGKDFRYTIISSIPRYKQNKILDAFQIEPFSDNFNKNFKWSVENYVAEQYNSFIEDFMEANKKLSNQQKEILSTEDFKKTVTDSVGYLLCERFSMPKGIYNSDQAFTQLDKFQSKENIILLCSATQHIAKSTIEMVNTILNEKEQTNEQTNQREETIHNRQQNEYSRADGFSSIDSRGSNGVTPRGNSTDTLREMGNAVSGIYGGETPSEENIPRDGGRMGEHRGHGEQRSQGNGTDITRAVSEIQQTPNRGLSRDTSVRPTDGGLYRRSGEIGDNLQSEINSIETNPKEPSNEGSFSMETIPELKPNQHIEVVDGVEFLFSGANKVEEKIEETQLPTPKPIFFEDFNTIRHELDYKQYSDGDIIGYDKKGVAFSVSFTDGYTFINTTTGMTPWGEVLGSSNIPPDILEQIKAYNNGEKQTELPLENEKEEQSWSVETEERQTDVERNHQEPTTTAQDTSTAETLSNFVIHSEEDIGLASGKTKYHLNVSAIKLLKELESQNRYANADEQQVLAKYSGFGGIPQAFDYTKENWAKEYAELKELLTDREYELARGSTLNAHYTSTTVIDAMYQGLERLGVSGGNILEPSMGVGNFFGKLPQYLQDKTRLYGVELDDITGRIAKQLYPKANIEISGFENAKVQDNFFDCAVGNVPFGSYSVFDTKFNKHNFLIHDYFLAKTLDKVKPEGVIAYITTKGTMDKANTSVRKYLAERAELLGAIRLPNNAFQQSAGTEVTTDIIFLKKRDKLIEATEVDWVYTNYHNTGKIKENGEAELVPLNQYFCDNPQMMLGEMRFDKSMYGNDKETALYPFQPPETFQSLEDKFTKRFEGWKALNNYDDTQLRWLEEFKNFAIEDGVFSDQSLLNRLSNDTSMYHRYSNLFDNKLPQLVEFINHEKPDKSNISLKDLLQQAVDFLPANVVSNVVSLDDLVEVEPNTNTIPADPTVKNFCYTVVDDKIYQRENSVMLEQELPKATTERLKKLIELREVTKNILEIQLAECSDVELGEAQGKLSDLYDSFVKKYGYINSKYNTNVFGEDAEYPLLSSIEEVIDDDNIIKADIFTKRTIMPFKHIESVETATEALAVSLNERGFIDIDFMSNLSSKSNEEIIEDLQGIIFKNPAKDSLNGRFEPFANWETGDEYLSGNVRQKLETAKLFATDNDVYTQNVFALEAVQPKPLEAHEITVKIGNSWIDINYYRQFMLEHFKPNRSEQNDLKTHYSNKSNSWYVSKPYSRHNSLEASEVFGTKRMDAYTLMENMLNQKPLKIYDTKLVDDKEVRELNKDETTKIRDKATSLNDTFKKWIFQDPARREALVEKYNKIYNSERVRQYDGSFLRFQGMNPSKKLKPHQENAVARILLGGNTLLAHCVGAGKSATRS